MESHRAICRLCGKSFYKRGLPTHLIFRHWMTIKEYEMEDKEAVISIGNGWVRPSKGAIRTPISQMRWLIKKNGERVLQQLWVDDVGGHAWEDIPEEIEPQTLEEG